MRDAAERLKRVEMFLDRRAWISESDFTTRVIFAGYSTGFHDALSSILSWLREKDCETEADAIEAELNGKPRK